MLQSFRKLQICFSNLRNDALDFKSDEILQRLDKVPDLEPIVNKIEAMYSIGDGEVLNPLDGADEAFDDATRELMDCETKLEALLSKYKKELGIKSLQFKDVGTKARRACSKRH